MARPLCTQLILTLLSPPPPPIPYFFSAVPMLTSRINSSFLFVGAPEQAGNPWGPLELWHRWNLVPKSRGSEQQDTTSPSSSSSGLIGFSNSHRQPGGPQVCGWLASPWHRPCYNLFPGLGSWGTEFQEALPLRLPLRADASRFSIPGAALPHPSLGPAAFFHLEIKLLSALAPHCLRGQPQCLRSLLKTPTPHNEVIGTMKKLQSSNRSTLCASTEQDK